MKFRIEYIFDERPAYLFARQLETGDFHLFPDSRLGGVAIKPFVSMPRAMTPEGKPDMTIFTFVLATANDLPKLKVGQIVELESPGTTA